MPVPALGPPALTAPRLDLGERSERALALTLGAIPLFVAANVFPIVHMEGPGPRAQVTLVGAARALFEQRLPLLAVLVVLTAVALPALRLAGDAWLLLDRGVRPPSRLRQGVVRAVRMLAPWAQVEIVTLGLVVAYVKLSGLFQVSLGSGAGALLGFLVVDLARRLVAPEPSEERPAPSDSLHRTTAFLVAAALLFVPANLLPVMTTRSALSATSDTILSGVVVLWQDGARGLAVLVFTASIAVPILKMVALALLVVTSARRSRWRRRERWWLFRAVELIGRWSMLDIFVMGVLAALVRSRMAGVQIEAGAMAFAAVVVLTMLSSASFDPSGLAPAPEVARE